MASAVLRVVAGDHDDVARRPAAAAAPPARAVGADRVGEGDEAAAGAARPTRSSSRSRRSRGRAARPRRAPGSPARGQPLGLLREVAGSRSRRVDRALLAVAPLARSDGSTTSGAPLTLSRLARVVRRRARRGSRGRARRAARASRAHPVPPSPAVTPSGRAPSTTARSVGCGSGPSSSRLRATRAAPRRARPVCCSTEPRRRPDACCAVGDRGAARSGPR